VLVDEGCTWTGVTDPGHEFTSRDARLRTGHRGAVVSEVVDVRASDPDSSARGLPRLAQVSTLQRSPGLAGEHWRVGCRSDVGAWSRWVGVRVWHTAVRVLYRPPTVVALGGQRGEQGTKRHARDPGWVGSLGGGRGVSGLVLVLRAALNRLPATTGAHVRPRGGERAAGGSQVPARDSAIITIIRRASGWQTLSDEPVRKLLGSHAHRASG
jgi:hypothetical protein